MTTAVGNAAPYAVPSARQGVGVNAPSFIPSLNTSLTPGLSAPSLGEAVLPGSALSVSVKAVQPQSAVPVSVPTALKPASVTAAAPSKADDFRKEVADAVAGWKAKRAAETAGESPLHGQELPPSLKAEALDALFDGSLPASREVLERAAASDLDVAALGLAISESKTTDEAAKRLMALGVLGPLETALATADPDSFRFLLVRLWRRAAPSIPAQFKSDDSFGLPALKVERGGVTYWVHGVTHGQRGAPRRGAVLKTAANIEKAGHALYSEHHLPLHYGYGYGHETLDQAAADGSPAEIAPAANGLSRAQIRAAKLIDWLVSPGSAIGAAVWAVASHGAPLALLAVLLTGVYAWLVLTGSLPLIRMKRRARAARARADGFEDMADQYAEEADLFLVASPKAEDVRGLELPKPLGIDATDSFTKRSLAIADAAAAHAAAAGAANVHLIVGHLHAQEVAWRLSAPAPESQIS